MKKSLALLLAISLLSFETAHAGKFSSGRSFSSYRSSGFRSVTPRYSPPRPIIKQNTVIQRNTVIHQTQPSSSGFGSSLFGSLLGAGVGSYIGSSLAQPTVAPPPTQPVYPPCPNPVPKGYNTPCLPQSQ